MIKNYIKIAWRNLARNRIYSVINIGGLAIGMAVSFMLLLYVYNEFSFDKFNVNSKRLYQVMRNQAANGELTTTFTTPVPLAQAMQKDIPGIEKAARANSGNTVLINYNNKAIKLKTLAADEQLLDMFSFYYVYGNRHNALSDQSSIVLTQSGAKAIFGDVNPIGKIVKFDNKYPLKVSAVINDNPQNSSINFKALISWQTYSLQHQSVKQAGWGNYSFLTYVLLKPGVSIATVNTGVKNINNRYDNNTLNSSNTFFIYPFSKLHLYNDFKNGISTGGGSIEYVRLFLLLAISILIIACINFMNLSTAQCEHRAKEVGVRKAVGARRFSLVLQFMAESLLMALLSFVFSLILITLLIPFFNTIINIQLQVPYDNLWAWCVALSVTLFTGLLAGSYPALFLSSFKPVKVLKGQLIASTSTFTPRRALVIVQFTFAICLIISSIFIYRQLNYIKNRPVGYNQNSLIEIPLEGNLYKQFDSFRQDAINAGAITNGAITSGSITNNGSASWGITWPGQLPGQNKLPIDQIAVTYNFIDTYGLSITQGRDFLAARPADSTAIILNQAAVKLMGFKKPLGQQVKWQGEQRTVVGVVNDFVWGSPYEPVKPAIIAFAKDWANQAGLKLNPRIPLSKSLALLQALHKKYNPAYPFEYKFTDESFNKKFKTEKLLGTMATCFTCLAISISCLGLFGLASFSASQRRKEIGIRKILGASAGNLWFILSQEFVGLVCISFILGSAISWYIIHQHFTKYTYHASISIWVFILTMLLSLAICLLTVSWQAIKAAIANPVKSLRSE